MLELQAVSVRYGSAAALESVSLSVAAGELVSVLGPSGSGKSSLLRVIAGLEQPVHGRILLEGRDLAGVSPHERGFGLMFQDFALFPHRDVAGNVAFGLRMQGLPERRIRARVAEVLELVDLRGMGERPVTALSGGEQQRVALARALAPEPRLLMLDEPLGSLDRSLRERLPLELRALFRRLGVTALYVTHDQDEALAVADRTIILRDGRVEADGTPEALWSVPPTRFVARFLGFSNIADSTVFDGVATTPWGPLPLAPAAIGDVRSPAGGRRPVLVRADAFRPDADGPVHGRVVARRFRGDHMLLELAVPGAPALEVEARWRPVPDVGDEVVLGVEAAGVVPLGDPAPPPAVPR